MWCGQAEGEGSRQYWLRQRGPTCGAGAAALVFAVAAAPTHRPQALRLLSLTVGPFVLTAGIVGTTTRWSSSLYMNNALAGTTVSVVGETERRVGTAAAAAAAAAGAIAIAVAIAVGAATPPSLPAPTAAGVGCSGDRRRALDEDSGFLVAAATAGAAAGRGREEAAFALVGCGSTGAVPIVVAVGAVDATPMESGFSRTSG